MYLRVPMHGYLVIHTVYKLLTTFVESHSKLHKPWVLLPCFTQGRFEHFVDAAPPCGTLIPGLHKLKDGTF